MAKIELIQAQRLALARAGLLKPQWTGLPPGAAGRGRRARNAAHEVIRRFGYLQLDTVSIAGARSHAIVLHSRLDGFDIALAEELLQPGEPLFEYWGHEVCWIPIELYPVFGFRRREFQAHPWWGDLVGKHPEAAETIRRRLRQDGPLRSAGLDGSRAGKGGWWNLKTASRVAAAMWSSGELAIRQRRNFQRTYDFAERVIPEKWRSAPELSLADALRLLLLKALEGHGWASAGTLARTWRLRNLRQEVQAALSSLAGDGKIVACDLAASGGRTVAGWIRPEDLELAERLRRVRPRADRGVLLSPFDPLLWDRGRVEMLFGFDQVLEIFKPAPDRKYGYYCLPVLAGERLIARFDLKAERPGRLKVISCRFEDSAEPRTPNGADREAARSALERYARGLGLETVGWK